MTADLEPAPILVAVGAVIWNDAGQVLLIRRANPPRQHEWSLPGGKVEWGEPLRTALQREVREETGLGVDIRGLIDVVELVGDESGAGQRPHYVLIDFTARAAAGEAVAASDATDVRWFSVEEITTLELWSETRRVIGLSANKLSCTL